MRRSLRDVLRLGLALSGGLVFADAASALELDWGGQFRSEAHWVKNYAMDNGTTVDATRAAAGGYYIPGGGAESAHFQTLFLRLKPRLIVNDNVYIKSEWWVGDPVYGFFGSGAPFSTDQRQIYSNQSRGSTITAQRYWAEILTDFGTFQVGRAPLHYGLGILWNNGDGLWDRYQSTGDAIRLVSKFGAFTFSPALVKYSMGNNIGGACFVSTSVTPGTSGSVTSTCSPVVGGGGVSDYSLLFQYENPDEDFEGSVNFIRRIAGASQDPTSGYQAPTSPGGGQAGSGANFNTWDLYGKKKWGKFSLSGEIPITTGDIAGLSYKTFAVAVESEWKINDAWETMLRAGHAPGQTNFLGSRPDRYRAFYFNPAYRIALIMFNYQLAGFAGPNTQNDPRLGAGNLTSPWDNPITNARYLNLGGSFRADKWTFKGSFTYAQASEGAIAGQGYLNTWDRSFYTNGTAENQSTTLGWEMDYGVGLKLDDNFSFGLDVGWFFPGDFYKFSNVTGTPNKTATVFASALRAGVNF